MKVLLSLAFSVVICTPLMADIVVTPDVQAAFQKSDLVCKCFVKSTVVMDERSIPNRPGVFVIQRRMRASVEIRDSYKTQDVNHRSIVVEYVQDIPNMSASQPALKVGEMAVMFLKATGPTSYVFSDGYLGAIPFGIIPQQIAKPGLAKLGAALIGTALQGDHDNSARALRLLRAFDSLDQSLLLRVVPLCSSKDPEIAFSALALLLKTKTPESVERLRRYVETYKGSEPMALGDIAPALGEIRDPTALPALQTLSGSRFVAIRRAAMDAMRGIKSPRNGPVLVQRLDDSDPLVQYLAVITLAETFGKFQDYAPGIGPFNKNPQYYRNLWKKWWAENGR